MPRKLIIIILVLLILGIIGGTVVLVMRRLRGSGAQPSPSPAAIGLSPDFSQAPVIANPTGDDDDDELSNADEAKWGTNPNRPDTDGDGYQDGEEVKAAHNPTVAGPNDKLPDGFEPQKDLKPIAEAPLQLDQYFEDSLDLTKLPSLTQAYDKQYKDSEKSDVSLFAFVKEQPVETKLPTVKQNAIKTIADDTPGTLSQELSVVGDLAVLKDKNTLNDGIRDLLEDQNGSTLSLAAFNVRKYQDKLLSATVPPSALPLHKLLLGYTELLASTLTQMSQWEQDPVRTLVAMRQLDAIDRAYYPLISQELRRLQNTLPSGGF